MVEVHSHRVGVHIQGLVHKRMAAGDMVHIQDRVHIQGLVHSHRAAEGRGHSPSCAAAQLVLPLQSAVADLLGILQAPSDTGE